MRRSRKKTKIQGMITAVSEKQDKRIANRKLRRSVKQKVDSDDELPTLRDVSNIWGFDKDGKQYCSNMSEKDLRK